MAISIATIGLVAWAFIEAVHAEPAVVGAVTTAALGVAGVVWLQRRSEKARLREAHRDRMTPVYHELLRRVWEQVGKESQDPTEEMTEPMRDLKPNGVELWRAREVVVIIRDQCEYELAASKGPFRMWRALRLAKRAFVALGGGVLIAADIVSPDVTGILKVASIVGGASAIVCTLPEPR